MSYMVVMIIMGHLCITEKGQTMTVDRIDFTVIFHHYLRLPSCPTVIVLINEYIGELQNTSDGLEFSLFYFEFLTTSFV